MSAAASESCSILVVEKDPVTSHLFKKSLQENPQTSYLVDFAVDETEAITKISDQRYDLLLIETDDEQSASALHLIKQIRSRHLNLPVVLMTSSRNQELAKQARHLGVSGVLIKSESNFHDLSNILRRSVQKDDGRELEDGADEALGRDYRQAFNREKGQNFRDELTGLCNHSCIHERMLSEFTKASQRGYAVSFLLLDLDHFKSINEKFGHQTGDEVLRQCGELLFKNCRLTDVVARFSGEQFAVLLPFTDYAGAEELADRLIKVFGDKVFGIHGEERQLTVSIGLASYPKDAMQHYADLASFAGEALYRAKALGRNCVIAYQNIMAELNAELPTLQISQEKISEFQHKMSEIACGSRKAYVDASKALIKALENKDPFTAGHAERSVKYALPLAQAMGMIKEDAEIVQHAALLHDIGKICIPDNVLLKPSRLSFMEYEAMKQHPYLGYKILKPIRFLQQEAIFVLHHHEWFNGEGYPCRLKGNEIPIGSRIIAVIEAYDTMRTAGDRYRKTCLASDAVHELIICAGTQFDPLVVQAFIEVLKSNQELDGISHDYRRLAAAVKRVSSPDGTL